MSPGFLEWTVRVTMLVLAGLVTLSILGSIAAMSNDVAPGGFAVERSAPPADAPGGEAAAPQAPIGSGAPADGRQQPVAQGGGGISGPAAAASAQRDEIARWLEALTYALLALAGLAAIGLILLWQVLRQLRRSADAAEGRPRG